MITTPKANIPTNNSPIDVSSPSTVCRLTNSIANTMTAAAIATHQRVQIQHNGRGDSGNDTVNESVTEETHPSQNKPGADDRGHHRRENTTEECPLLESKGERLGEPLHSRSVFQVPRAQNA